MGSSTLDKALRVFLYFRLQDYILCVVCGFIALGVSKARPHCRPFSWSDASIDFSYGGAGTFPSWTLPILSVLPGVVYVLGEALRHLYCTRRWSSIQLWSPVASAHAPLMEGAQVPASPGTRSAASPNGRAVPSYPAAITTSTPPKSHVAVAVEMQADMSRNKHDAANRAPVADAGGSPRERREDAMATTTTKRSGASPTPGSPISMTPGATESVGDGTDARPRSRRAREVPSTGLSALLTTWMPSVADVAPLPWQRFLVHAHAWVLTQAFAVTLAMLIVDASKVYAGRLRPDFLARLRRAGYNENSTGVDWCEVPKGGRVSFPSGHSGISFAAFVPFSAYALHSFGVFQRTGTSLWRTIAGLTPLILPITVAVSRTRDNRHHFDDILAGSLIGIATALLAMGANFAVNSSTGQLVPRFGGS